MISTILDINNLIFFKLHGYLGTSVLFDHSIYLVAEIIDWYLIGFALIFMLSHQHSYRSNNPRFFSRTSLREGIYILFGVLFAWASSYLLKISFAAPRPFLYFTDVTSLFMYGGYDSFPSGHATLFAAIATSLYFHHKKMGIFFGVMAFVIGLARVIAGVHFPIDIVAGWTLGVIIPWGMYRYLRNKKLINIT